MKLNELFESDNEHAKEKRAAVVELGKRYPKLSKLTKDVSGHTWSFLDSLGSSIGFLWDVDSGKEAKEITELLRKDKLFRKYFHADDPQESWDGKTWSLRISELRDKKERDTENRLHSRSIEKAKNVKINIPDTIPKSAFSKDELIRIAKKVGEALFSKHHSGLIWNGNAKIEFTNTKRMLKEYVDSLGDSADLKGFTPGTFEYVMKPSTETGVDASDHINLVTQATKLKDKDSNIYLVDNTDDTLIRVVAPVIKTKDEFYALLAQYLKEQK